MLSEPARMESLEEINLPKDDWFGEENKFNKFLKNDDGPEDCKKIDEGIARKLQVNFDNVKSNVLKLVDDNLREPLNKDIDNDLEDDIFPDIGGIWEDGGNWEKFDHTGMSLISYIDWRALQNCKATAKRKPHFCVLQRKKTIYKWLSSKQEFDFIVKKFINPNIYLKERWWGEQLLNLQKRDVIATECMENLDEFTFWLFNKMIYRQLLKDVNGIVNIDGEHSIILRAQPNPNYSETIESLPERIALKVFKRTFVKHKSAGRYSVEYLEAPSISHLPRRTVNSLAEKEFIYLRRLRNLGIRCPEPIDLLPCWKRHIVAMSFIGEDMTPSPKLKDVYLSRWHRKEAFKEIKEAMKTMYQEANVIHKNLLNHILWHNKHCYFIDFSHVLEKDDSDAHKVLFDNCNLIIKFFSKNRIYGTVEASKLFQYITDLEYLDDS